MNKIIINAQSEDAKRELTNEYVSLGGNLFNINKINTMFKPVLDNSELNASFFFSYDDGIYRTIVEVMTKFNDLSAKNFIEFTKIISSDELSKILEENQDITDNELIDKAINEIVSYSPQSDKRNIESDIKDKYSKFISDGAKDNDILKKNLLNIYTKIFEKKLQA